MERFVNKPVNVNYTDEDIIEDYNKYNDKKIVAKRYCITVKEATEIIKKAGNKNVSER